MIIIEEHTIEETIINKNGWVLDLGCINFKFSLEMKKYCDNIICVDPNPNIIDVPDEIFFEKAAIVANETSEVNYYIYDDIHGCSLLNPKQDWCNLVDNVKIPALTIESLMNKYGIKKFELIKFDIEGSEYDLLNKIDWAITKQISVEFHDFRFMNPYYPNNELYYNNLFNNKAKNYNIVQHNITNHPGFPENLGANYWDSLFVEK